MWGRFLKAIACLVVVLGLTVACIQADTSTPEPDPLSLTSEVGITTTVKQSVSRAAPMPTPGTPTATPEKRQAPLVTAVSVPNTQPEADSTVKALPVPTATLPETASATTALPATKPTPTLTPSREVTPTPSAGGVPEGANVVQVSVSGTPGSYSFSVTVSSPDTGCDQYADWWEVVSPEGRLIYRRVLLHSHVNEQPFTRSGGPVNVQRNETVIVRAHMNPTGYVGFALSGNVADGFSTAEIPAGFAEVVALLEPLPTACAF